MGLEVANVNRTSVLSVLSESTVPRWSYLGRIGLSLLGVLPPFSSVLTQKRRLRKTRDHPQIRRYGKLGWYMVVKRAKRRGGAERE
jgi:hypothetical protein